uniref:7TM_GPCR_Srx domain-containing protein n=1 Tax=Steinernema glaseri TaxID=37863 RepID=A0A1I7Z7X7_9BILA
MQLVALAAGGVMTITGSTFNYYLDKIFGMIIESGWWLYVALTATLAVDRLLIFHCPNSSRISTLLLGLSWLLWIIVAVILSLPSYGITYNSDGRYYFWEYNNEEGSVIMAKVDLYYDLVVFSFTFVIYIVVFVYVIKVKSSRSKLLSSTLKP